MRFPGGVVKHWNFQMDGCVTVGGELENPERWGGGGCHNGNPFHGGLWLFSGTTQCVFTPFKC